MIFAEVFTGNDNPVIDLDGDGLVDADDVTYWVTDPTLGDTFMGDINLDGAVDEFDLAALADHFGDKARRWAFGDLNGDASTDNADVVILASNWFAHDPLAAPISSEDVLASFGIAVPEPASLWLSVWALTLIPRRRARVNPSTSPAVPDGA